jgi:hypothetical protein
MPVLKPKRLLTSTKTKPVEKKGVKPSTSKAPATPAKKTAVERNEYGITVGSDQDIILREMIAGGADKHEIIERCNVLFAGRTTSGGKPKPVSTVVNQLIHAMRAKGFKVESTWRIIPPAEGVQKPSAPARSMTKKDTAAPTKGLVRLPATKKTGPRTTAGKPSGRKLPVAGKVLVRKAA